MNVAVERKQRRFRRKKGLRKRAFGTPVCPRMSVFRSLKHTYVQVINDLDGKTIASASTNEKSEKTSGSSNCVGAKDVGRKIAERAKAAGVNKVVFDRNGFRYHGRIKALADAAREGGLKF